MKLASKLPRENGLEAVEPRFLGRPQEFQYAIVAFTTKAIISDMDEGGREAVIRIESVEPFTLDSDITEAQLQLRRMYERRTNARQTSIDDQSTTVSTGSEPYVIEVLELGPGSMPAEDDRDVIDAEIVALEDTDGQCLSDEADVTIADLLGN